MRIVPHSVTLLHSTPDPERVIERAGRVCWKSEDRITDDLWDAYVHAKSVLGEPINPDIDTQDEPSQGWN